MTYRDFLTHFTATLSKKTMFLFDGGPERVRSDALYILRKKFEIQKKDLKLRSYREKVYHLSEIANLPAAVTSGSTFNLTIIQWEKGLLSDKEIKQFLRGCRDTKKIWFAILDGSGEVGKVFKDVFPKNSSGLDIDCGKVSDEEKAMVNMINNRLGIVGVTPSEEVVKFLASGDEVYGEQLFNTFYILEALKEPKVDVELLRKHSLIIPNVEYHLMRVLFDKGKLAFLSQSNVDYDDGRILRYIIRELILMLKCKTVRGSSDQKKSSMVKLTYLAFLDYKKKVEKVELSLLYRRLYSALMSLRYGGLKGSTLLLLSSW
jgi:hypothetical protein